MIVNVIDLGLLRGVFFSDDGNAESASKDNVVEDADKVKPAIGVEIDYAERAEVSVRDAVLWADRMEGMVTLYLYDLDHKAEAG